MPTAVHLAKLNEGVEAWNKWRVGEEISIDLSTADLSGKDLRGVDLRSVNLENANLREARLAGALLSNANLTGASLCRADLRGSDLLGSNLNGVDLFGTILRECNLQGVDISVAKGDVRTEQLAGADLTGAILPAQLTKLFERLDNVNNISESARKLFLGVLVACLYSWLTIATTTDTGLVTNRASSPLPIIQSSIPIVGFYFVAPLLLLCVFFYFQFYLQKLWEELASLPAIFPDGRALHTKIDPWLLNDLVRAHTLRLRRNRPFLSYFQLQISILLAWWIVPASTFLFWGRYLRRREQIGTTFHTALLVISMIAALSLYRLAIATLRGAERKAFSWKGILTSRSACFAGALVIVGGVLFGLIAWNVIASTPDTWTSKCMTAIGYSPYANLRGAELSQKTSDPIGTGAQLDGFDLRYASASGAFLADADLAGVNFVGADLQNADLRNAKLLGTDLRYANLRGANLSGSEVLHANIDGADFSRADLQGVSLFEPEDVGATVQDLAIECGGAGADPRLIKQMLGFSVRLPDLREVNLKGSHLGLGDLSKLNLNGTNFSGADLNHTDLHESFLANADLSGANLSCANMRGAQLLRTDLRNAFMFGVDLINADLTEAKLMYADLRSAKNVSPTQLKQALDWNLAYYDITVGRALGLTSNHNEILDDRQKHSQGSQ